MSHPVISHHRAWLRSVSRLSMKRRLGMKESGLHGNRGCCKKGRQSNETEEFNKGSGEKGGSTEGPVSTTVPKIVNTARPELSTASPDVEDSVVEPRTPPTTTSIFDDEDITMDQTLIKMKEEKAKEKVEDSSRPTRSTLTLKPLPTIDLKDKGKSVLEEPEPAKKMTRSDFDAAQIARDAEIARQLQVNLQAKASFNRKKERSIQLKKQQSSWLKQLLLKENSELHKDLLRLELKAKSFEEIKGMYERQKKSVQDFVPIGSAKEEELIKKTNEKATDEDSSNKEKVLEEPDSTKVKFKQEGHEDSTRKRPGRRLKMKATKKSKRQKTDSDLEEEEQLKAFLMIVPDEEGIIDYEVLEKRSDGSSRWIKTFSEMVTRFDRLDLEELYNLVMKRFETTTPEGVDLDLYENCGVHTLILEDGTEIHMLAERKYPLTKETLERMLSLRLVAGTASEDAYTLLRFIQKQIDEHGSHDGGEKDL
ncbi:hypothetical protein Tco_0980666 [Tanacetum coccineum]